MDAFYGSPMPPIAMRARYVLYFPSMPGAIWQTPLPCGVKARIINFSDAKPGDWDDLLSRGVCFYLFGYSACVVQVL